MDLNTLSANKHAHDLGIQDQKDIARQAYIDDLVGRTMNGDNSVISLEWINQHMAGNAAFWDCVHRLISESRLPVNEWSTAVIASEIAGIKRGFVNVAAADISVAVV